MEDKLVKLGMVIIGVGCVYFTHSYGKYMYSKGLVDADAIYRPIMDADHKLIHALIDKLQKAEGSQK